MADTVDFSHSIQGLLYLEDAEFLLLEVSYGLNRNADERGHPTDAPKRLMIRAKVRVMGEENADARILYDWAVTSDKKIDGHIIFGQYDDMSVQVRRMDFRDATCVGFRECFQNDQLNVMHGGQTVHVPNAAEYRPQYRGGTYFVYTLTTSAYYLVISADTILIESAEVPS